MRFQSVLCLMAAIILAVHGRATAQNAATPAQPLKTPAEIRAEVEALLTPETVAKIEKGEVVAVKKGAKDAAGRSSAEGRAMILINRPWTEVWDQLVTNEEYPEFMPHSSKSEEYFRNGNEVGLNERVKALFLDVSYYVIHTRDRDARVIAWRLDHSKKNDINETVGSWTFCPHGENACILVYSARIESGMFLPKAVENFFMNRDLPGIVKAVKKRVEGKAQK